MTDDLNPEQYLPVPRQAPEDRSYVGSGDARVFTSLDGSTVLVSARKDNPAVPRADAVVPASDPFLAMDFRPFTSANGVTFNAGQVDYETWNGLHWRQAYITIPETEVPLTVTDATKYIHLVIPTRTNTPTSDSSNGPFVPVSSVGSLGTPFEYADINIWQGPSGVAPSYVVGEIETLPNIEDLFRPLLASINAANGLMMHHCGAISIPQGYRPGFVHLSP